MDNIDENAQREAAAISNSYKPRTMGFGIRKHSKHCNDLIVRKQSRKRVRHRNPRQIDLRKQKLVVLGKELKKRKVCVEVQL